MRFQRIVTTIFTVLAVAGLFGCSGQNDGTMPISTSSDVARREYLEGRTLLEKLRGQEAIPHLQKAIEEDPSFAMAHLMLATAQQTPKDFFASFNRAVSLLDNASKLFQVHVNPLPRETAGRAD